MGMGKQQNQLLLHHLLRLVHCRYNAHLSLRLHLDMELLFTNDSHLTPTILRGSSALALSSFAVGFAAFPGTFIAESTAASTERAGSRSSVQSTEAPYR